MAPSSDSPSAARRALVWVIVVALVLVAGICGAWFYLAGRLDDELSRGIAAARSRGTEIECPNRDVFGFPFRIGFRCDALSIVRNDDRPLRISAGAVRTAAQIYRPNRIVGELDGPMRVSGPQFPPLDIRWSLGQASATFWTEGLDHFAVVTDDPKVALVEPSNGGAQVVEASHSEAHARRRDGDLDIFTLMRGGRLTFAGAPDLPPLDASTDLTIGGAGDWLSGAARGLTGRELFAGRPVSLRSLLVEMGQANAELSGDFSFDDEGQVTGKFQLAIAEPKEIARLVTTVAPNLKDIAAGIASALPMAGRQADGRTTIELRVRNGVVAVGIFPIGKLPSLR
ncbi:DUF2125 domain-containing protein [Aurantimonas sp. 22II-16-19i]|uniref:DUF2125 domain-containing protein n=1 Tax=Aurantimonas sp. 22II-16-19i TaxID=1317114 RepID=UPI0009F7ACB0|nr:DUF2125 domain-containing protein [Aurantimonas sp. 22II-16-19i]ORE98847.1 hypothetical protein ATO4_00735 [Aurantimonas sp. 22II-16-19i]